MAGWILCLDELTIYNWRMKKTFFSFLSLWSSACAFLNIFCCHLQPLKETIQPTTVFSCGLSRNRKVRFFFFFNPYLETSSIDSFLATLVTSFSASNRSNSRSIFFFLTFLQNRKFLYTHMFLFLVCVWYRCAVKIYRL